MCVCTEKRTVANREVSSNIHYEMGKCCNSTALVESFLMCRFKRHVQLFFLDFILDFVEIFLKECNLCFCCVWFIYFFYVWIRHACKHCDHVAISHSQPVCQGFVSTQEDQRYLWSLWLDSDWDWQESGWVIGVTDSQSCPSDTHKIGTQVKQLAALVRKLKSKHKHAQSNTSH